MLKGRGGYRMGHDRIFDHMMLDGLEDAYAAAAARWACSPRTASPSTSSRARRRTSSRSPRVERAKARQRGRQPSTGEIAPVTVKGRGGDTVIEHRRRPFKAKLDKIPALKPAFKKDGTITAARPRQHPDGAAALVHDARVAPPAKLGAKPIARIVGHAMHAQAPEWFTTAPVGAIAEGAARRPAGSVKDVDLWEVNEAFAAVPMARWHEFKLPHEIVNVHGGACALGHPIGACGARIVVTLLGALKKRGKKRGVAALCIGGGEATAMALELV